MKDLIMIDPAICNGRPVVRGTRITVQTVMAFLAAGDTVEDVHEEYPALTRCVSLHGLGVALDGESLSNRILASRAQARLRAFRSHQGVCLKIVKFS